MQRLLREDNLLCIRKRQFVVTTDSRHNLRIYPNLAEFVYLAVMKYAWVPLPALIGTDEPQPAIL